MAGQVDEMGITIYFLMLNIDVKSTYIWLAVSLYGKCSRMEEITVDPYENGHVSPYGKQSRTVCTVSGLYYNVAFV